MDKKDAVEFALLKKDVDDLKRDKREIRAFVWSVLKQIFIGVTGLIIAGFHYGWFLSDSTRKIIADWWISR